MSDQKNRGASTGNGETHKQDSSEPVPEETCTSVTPNNTEAKDPSPQGPPTPPLMVVSVHLVTLNCQPKVTEKHTNKILQSQLPRRLHYLGRRYCASLDPELLKDMGFDVQSNQK